MPAGDLRPHPIGPTRAVPKHIPRPDYATTGIPAKEEESKKQRIVPVFGPEVRMTLNDHVYSI